MNHNNKLSFQSVMLMSALVLHSGYTNAGIGDALSEGLGSLGDKVMNGTGSGNGSTCMALGAVLGAVISKSVTKNSTWAKVGLGLLGGAASGATICALVNTTQTKKSAEVEKEYKKTAGNNLPSTPTVMKHTVTTIQGKSTTNVSKNTNEPITVQSDIQIVNGTQEKIQTIEEQITLVLPENKGVTAYEKKSINANSSGSYKSSWDLGMSPDILKDLPTGVYQIKSTIFVNGKSINSDISSTFTLV